MLDTVNGEPYEADRLVRLMDFDTSFGAVLRSRLRENGSRYIFEEKYKECVLELDMMSIL